MPIKIETDQNWVDDLPEHTTSSPYIFDRTSELIPLHEACIYVATGGRDTTTEKIVEKDMEGTGATKLFSMLAGNSSVKAFGESPARYGREEIEARYWSRAEIDDGGIGSADFGDSEPKNIVRFKSEAESISASLSFGENSISHEWYNIKIDRKTLVAALSKNELAEGSVLTPYKTISGSESPNIKLVDHAVRDAWPNGLPPFVSRASIIEQVKKFAEEQKTKAPLEKIIDSAREKMGIK